ncbi:MAG: class I SAM-dependent methyltransferase [Candidatus Paceibacterota bacterium]|jgi:SAM-dependent methyltransferase
MTQVTKDAYRFERYVGIDRWSSYYYQLREIVALEPKSVLEIGVGDRVVGNYLKGRGIEYTSADVAEDLSPDVVADVTALPFGDGSFDVVCAFEILEHLPFERFKHALQELTRVSKRAVLLSLPHFGPSVRLELKIPLLPCMRLAWKLPYPKKHVFNGQHYWEIGKRGYSLNRIRAAIALFGGIQKEFVPFENQYHHFFLIEKL